MSRAPKFKPPEGMEVYPEDSKIDPAREVIIEIGPGRGDFLFRLAKENPHAQVIGIEIKPKRFAKLIPRLERLELKNTTIFLGDGRIILKEKLDGVVASQVYVLFPDPWPKKRHAKHRLFQRSFLETLRNRLKDDGSVVVATDDQKYADEIQEIFQSDKRWKRGREKGDCPLFGGTVPFFTFYAEKWRADGRNLQFLQYTPSPIL